LATHSTINFLDPLARQILRLRADAYGRAQAGQADELDVSSTHFVSVDDSGNVIAAIRMTKSSDCRLESQDVYPDDLFSLFGNQLGACSRFCIDQRYRNTSTGKRLLRYAWMESLDYGMRLDVSKARVDAIPFYLKIGYMFLPGTLHEFQNWRCQCGLIALPADKRRASWFQDLFEHVVLPTDYATCDILNSAISSEREFKDHLRTIEDF
jgi:predicted GNAT family N-acyltransferase